ncbi:quinone oxidoreductase family protein [Gracilibacillus phocaeensis]|uniref:quinone oxidoreductase family protein n=1 Tax=Gracilibacillus phocaeensis TaxID=2042304 RepID=UPI001030608B|nr:zinc-binding alcohol dehydrogenase family protein [Gracilibacillus phocaeensis]
MRYVSSNSSGLVIKNHDLHPPEKDEVQIEVSYASLNYADILGIEGRYHAKTANFTPGFDCVGYIKRVSENIKDFHIGEKVAAIKQGGTFAEQVNINKNQVFKLKNNLCSRAVAANISNGVTAYDLVFHVTHIKPNDQVFIYGASGGVGSLLVQFCKYQGAHVTALTKSNKKQYVESLGADHLILRDRPANDTDKLYDRIFNPIGGESIEQDLLRLSMYGHLITYGHSSFQAGYLNTEIIHSKNLSILGYSSGSIMNDYPIKLRKTVHDVMNLVYKDKISTPIDSIYSMDEMEYAFEKMKNNRHIGKILIKMDT